MALKVVDWSCRAHKDHSPSPSSYSTEMLDLTKPTEEDNCASLARSSDETVDWSQSPGGDLGNPPVLDPHVCDFLLGTEASGNRGEEPDQSTMSEPSFNNPQEWVRWHACWAGTPAWWAELVKVPTPRDLISFAKWVWASFQFPKAKFLGKGENDYTPPPAPHCIEWDAFLPQTKSNFARQDYRLRQ